MQVANAQVYSSNIVGYVNRAFVPGNNLFATPLDTGGGDTLSELFTGYVPDGTTVSLWNPSIKNFDTTSTYNLGSWSQNLTLLPGTGAELSTSTLFTNTFVGNALNHDGGPLGGSGNPTPPPVYSGPNGVFLVGDKCPIYDSGTDIFLSILGRAPNHGEQVIWWDPATQTYTTSTYLGSGRWSNNKTPTLQVSGAAFLNVGPVPFNITSVPEPSSLALAGLGASLLIVGRQNARRKTIQKF
jgi:hypothetical protein